MINLLGVGATGYEASYEYSRYKTGESVFNSEEDRSQYIKRQFLENCERMYEQGEEFSADCPQAVAQRNEDPITNISSNNNLIIFGIFGLVCVVLLLIFI
jgi:hypothetical protein